MTYRECYAKHIPTSDMISSVHELLCPVALQVLGENVPEELSDEECIARLIDGDCAACWDQEMEG